MEQANADATGVGSKIVAPTITLRCPDRLQRLYRDCANVVLASHYEHDLRNTFGAISSSVFFLKRRMERIDGDPRIASSLEVIDMRVKDATTKLKGHHVVCGDLTVRQVLISTVASHLIEALELPARVRVEKPAASLARLFARADELELVVFCLIENAVEAVGTRGGGTVWVRVINAGEPMGIVEVEDDGPGFLPEIAEDATRVFVTSKPHRLGLGLAIVKHLVGQFGGSIDITRGQRGAAVRLHLTGWTR